MTVLLCVMKPTTKGLSALRELWMDKIVDLISGIPPKVLPFRTINHQINLIDLNKWIHYQLPKCPDTLKEELAEKISCYTSRVPAMVRQAVPMLCVPKKNNKLRMVFNLCVQNENTKKDVSPFLDQDTIQHDIACAAYRSKLDMSEAYEQIHVCPEDVLKTAFATIFGMFVSLVMQQGNCNAPSTFQRLMTVVFHDYITCFVHVYLDDIFIYSLSIKEHKKHLELVFNKLREAQLYLSQDKVDLCSQRMDCLSHIISDAGIHACVDKMQKIWDW